MNDRSTSLVMIVRDEEKNLAGCLDSVKGTVDEIVIVDTGSTDRTVAIAARYTERIYHFPWRNDFSAARNHGLERARGRWILSLDADERLDPASGCLRLPAAERYEAFFLPLFHQAGDSPADYTSYPVLRLFRNNGEYRFRGPIHEQVIIPRPGAVGFLPAPVIRHQANTDRERRCKRGRNLALLKRALRADPANPFHQYYLGVEWLGLNKPGRALPCFQAACQRLSDAHVLFRAPAVRHLVACLKALGRIDEAACLCLAESQRYPFYADLFFDGGLVFEQKGDWSTAARWFHRAVTCGRPPDLFVHTNGTESFLSLYHLGLCHEKTARPAEAQKCYEEALAANPDYPYPLYNLLLWRLIEKGPGEAFSYLRSTGQLARRTPLWADFFFAAGSAALALRCLEEAGPDESDPGAVRRRVRLLAYGGRPREAAALARRFPELAVEETVSLILLGDHRAAKARALSLWRISRGAAWALLNLVSLAREGRPAGRPGRRHLPAAIETTLAVLENCSRAPDPAGHRLADLAIGHLRDLGPEGVRALAAYLREKAGANRRLLADRNPAVREFLP